MKKLYIIGGVGASGKTTFSEMLSKEMNIPVFKCDDVYLFVANKLGVSKDKIVHLPEPSTWDDLTRAGIFSLGVYPSIDECVKISYLEFFNYKIPDQLILESCSLIWNTRELNVVLDIFKDYDVRYFYIDVDYERWLKNRSNRKRLTNDHVPPFLEEDSFYRFTSDYLKRYPEYPYIIRDIDEQIKCSLTGGVEYQSSEKNDPKWSVFSFPDLTNKSFLEISCNTGWFLEKAKENGASNIYGIDISWQVLEVARDRVKEASVFLSRIEDFDLNRIGHVDFVLSSSAFHYYKQREDVIRRISEITDYFVLETPVINDVDIRYQSFGDEVDFCAVPGKELVIGWLKKYFKNVDEIGQTEMENAVPRPVFRCTK